MLNGLPQWTNSVQSRSVYLLFTCICGLLPFLRYGTSHLPVRLSVQVDIYYPIPSHCGVYCSSFHLVMLPLMVLFVPLHHLTDKNCRKMSYLAGRFYIDWWYEQFTVLINRLFFVKLMSWKNWQIPLKSSLVKCGLLWEKLL